VGWDSLLSRKLTEPSIRKQLLLWLLAPLVTLCTLSSMVAYRMAEKFAHDSYDRVLLESADSIAARLGRNENGVLIADLPMAAQAILRHNNNDHFYYQIADNYGHRLTGDAVLPLPRDVGTTEPRFRYATLNDEQVRMCRIGVQIAPHTDTIWVQVAETLNSRQMLLHQIFVSILAPQLALVALASISVWLGIKHGLTPLQRLGSVLEKRDKLDLSPVDIGRTPMELAPVTKALNELFLSANDHIHVQRQFIGNAAHQMRTPVTALKTYLEYAERIKDPSALSGVLRQMGEATRRVAHLVNRLLSLARTEENVQRTRDNVDLTEVINSAAANVIHEAFARNVIMEFDLPVSPVTVRVDRADLEELVSNLLDNAIRYTAEKGSVWVKVENQGDHVALRVEDNGPGIPDSEKPKIFERFYRAPGSKGPGCGLGLSIVSEIAAANAAAIQVLDRDAGGTVVKVDFEPGTKET
jgi:two-component system, OmpR family, sensor histidine kinase TctE